MVNLTRIYTRTGDDGTTALGDLSRTRKTDPRLAAYADANEANAAIGVAVACGDLPDDVRAVLTRVQNDLFDVGADLSTPLQRELRVPAAAGQAGVGRPSSRPTATTTSSGSRSCAPSSSPAARPAPPTCTSRSPSCAARSARCGRRSRPTAPSPATPAGEGGVNPVTATYLNRLSDLLFVLARCANLPGGDVLWQPGGGREQPPPALTADPTAMPFDLPG